MWYFTWVLGVGFACAFAILNALWLEAQPVIGTQATSGPNDVDRDCV
jgi:cytochrome bd-I ubiquinol oxidase subunit X